LDTGKFPGNFLKNYTLKNKLQIPEKLYFKKKVEIGKKRYFETG